MTGMPASGLPFSSTTWPETSVEARAGSVTVIGSTIVPDAVPLETATEKSKTPCWPGAGAKTSSPVSRLKVMFAGSGWGVMVKVRPVVPRPRFGRVTSRVPPTATESGILDDRRRGDRAVVVTGDVDVTPPPLCEADWVVVTVVCAGGVAGLVGGDCGAVSAAVRWWAAAYLG